MKAILTIVMVWPIAVLAGCHDTHSKPTPSARSATVPTDGTIEVVFDITVVRQANTDHYEFTAYAGQRVAHWFRRPLGDHSLSLSEKVLRMWEWHDVWTDKGMPPTYVMKRGVDLAADGSATYWREAGTYVYADWPNLPGRYRKTESSGPYVGRWTVTGPDKFQIRIPVPATDDLATYARVDNG